MSPRFRFGSPGRSSRVIFGGGGGGVSVTLPWDGEGGGGGRSSSLESGGKALEDVEGVLFPLSMKTKDCWCSYGEIKLVVGHDVECKIGSVQKSVRMKLLSEQASHQAIQKERTCQLEECLAQAHL